MKPATAQKKPDFDYIDYFRANRARFGDDMAMWLDGWEKGFHEGKAALEKSDSSALKDAHNEIRTRIIDILDECDRTVYAQQKWKVAHAGLQGWLFKIEVENPELGDSAATEKQERA